MIAGTLELQMLANLARLSKDMNDAKTMVGGAMSSIERSVGLAKTALGALGVGLGASYFAGLINSTIDAADHLNDLSKTTRLTVETLSGLKLASKQSGSDLDSVAQSIGKLGQNIGKEPEKFKALGISATDPLEAFKQLADITNKLQDPFQRNAVLAAALGKSWQGTAPMLAEGSEKIQEMVDKGIALSGMTKKLAQDADDLRDKQAELNTSLDRTKNLLLTQMMPALLEIMNTMAEVAKESNGLKTAWVGLGGVLLWLLGLTDSQKLAKQLKEIDEAIATARKQLSAGTLNPAGASDSFFSFLIPNVKLDDRAKARLRYTLEDLEKQRNALSPPAKAAKQETAAEKAAKEQQAAAAKAAAERFLQDQKAANAAREEYLKADAKTELETLKDTLNHKQQMLDMAYQDNRIGDKAYFEQKVGLAKQAADAEVATLDELRDEQEAALEKTKRGTAEYWKALKEVEATEAAIAKVTREFGQTSEVSFEQARLASEAYKRSVESVNIQILQLTGQTAKAAALQFELSNRDARKKAVANEDPAAVAAIDRLGQLTAAQAEFNEQRDKLSEVNARLQIEEERIQNTLKTGSVSELDSMYKTGEARAASIRQQEVIVANLQKIAAASQNPALILQADQAAAALAKLRAEADVLGQKIETIFSTSGADALSGFIDRTLTARQAFDSFSDSVVKQINRMASEALSKRLFNALGMGGEGGVSGGIGGWLKGLMGGSAAVSNTAFGTTSFADALSQGIIPMADGGDFTVTRPTLFLAGEAGTERATFSGGGNRGSSGGNINVTNVFHVSGQTDKRSQAQIAAAAGEGVQRAMSRNT